MNWKKLIFGIIIVNIVSWLMLEFWIHRYSGGVGEVGAGFMAFFQLVGYYIVTIGSRIDEIEVEQEDKPIQPQDCPEHDWQKLGYSEDQCIICKATRSRH